MNAEPEAPMDPQVLEQTRRRINQLIEEIARLTESNVPPSDYYAEFLPRILSAIAAPAGAIWGRTAQGNLQMQYQVNYHEVGLDKIEGARASHDELLRQSAAAGRPRMVPPHSGAGNPEGGGPPPANLTNYVLLLAPIVVEKQVAGFIEVWQDPSRSASAQRGFLQFMTSMAEYASQYLRNSRLRMMLGQQQLWTQLESYSRQIHGSLSPKKVAYDVVNEGRRLVNCDRVSAAVRLGSHVRVEAISGADVVEKRSSLVQAMRNLFEETIRWGERLVYTGARDDSLPPRVLKALDEYLAESNSKFLFLQPLKDERDENTTRKARSALMFECFEPSLAAEQLMARAEVVTKHAAPAFYNAIEHYRIPFRWLLQPIANLRDGLRGRSLAIFAAVMAGIALVVGLLIVVPWELRMDARGEILPKERQMVYSRVAGEIFEVKVADGEKVRKGDTILIIRDPDLAQKIKKEEAEIEDAQRNIKLYTELLADTQTEDREKPVLRKKQNDEFFRLQQANGRLQILRLQEKDPLEGKVAAPISGTVVTFNPKDPLLNRKVKPGDPLLMVAQTDGDWEIQARVPQGQVGPIREALAAAGDGAALDVDLLLTTHPNRTFRGKLYRDGLGGEVTVHNNEPVLFVRVEIDEELRKELKGVPVRAEVRCKVRCGKRACGYVFFYELWEFFFERVIY